jgi:hypothetical protein
LGVRRVPAGRNRQLREVPPAKGEVVLRQAPARWAVTRVKVEILPLGVVRHRAVKVLPAVQRLRREIAALVEHLPLAAIRG